MAEAIKTHHLNHNGKVKIWAILRRILRIMGLLTANMIPIVANIEIRDGEDLKMALLVLLALADPLGNVIHYVYSLL